MSNHERITVRDMFAAEAMTALVAHQQRPDATMTSREDIADWAYEMADAMLARRGGSYRDVGDIRSRLESILKVEHVTNSTKYRDGLMGGIRMAIEILDECPPLNGNG